MKKPYLIMPFGLLMALMLASPVNAISTDLTVSPATILFGGTVTIDISVDTRGLGTLAVVDPKHIPHPYLGKLLVFPGTYSLKYPDDFLGGSTSQVGEYKVVLLVGGKECVAFFGVCCVGFFVIPELPLGTIMAVVAPFAAIAGLAIKRKLIR